MGATVTCGKRAGAFVAADGRTIYVLFERTYEKNCYPHTPHWECVAIGSYADVMRRIFRGAASCCGGMLQSTAGDILPENYIAGWARELRSPYRLFSTSTTIEIASSWRAPVPSESVFKAQIALAQCNLGYRFSEISVGLRVDLARDTDLVLALYGVDGPFGPWRILRDSYLDTVRVEADTPPTRSKQVPTPRIGCYAIDRENRLISIDGGPWRCSGWAYSTVQELVTEILYPLELLEPGHAKKAMPILRAQVNDAPQLPDETRVEIHRSPPGVPSWKIRSADTLAEILGICPETEAAPTRFSIQISDLANKENGTYHLSHLDHDQVRWHVPGVTAQPASTAEGASTDHRGLLAEFDTTCAPRPSATA